MKAEIQLIEIAQRQHSLLSNRVLKNP